jgi:predicted RNase H-like HicB family nuclease
LPNDDGTYTATIQEFTGLVADGRTAEEALRNLEIAADSWITVSLANGHAIKEPNDFEGCSGKVALRIPRSLHRQAAELAELEGTSINQVLVSAITSYVTGKKIAHEINGMFQRHVKNSSTIQITTAAVNLTAKIGTEVHIFENTALKTYISASKAKILPMQYSKHSGVPVHG